MTSGSDGLSLLVPYRSDQGRREFLFEWVSARWVEVAPEFEIVVGFESGAGPFNAARACNDAAARATGTVFCTWTADLLPDPVSVRLAAQHALDFGWASVFARTVFLDQQSTDRLIAANGENIDLDFEQIVDVCNGITAVRADIWALVGGQDERFEGWGPEDMAFRAALTTLVGESVQLPGSAIHLWHPPAEPNPANDELYKKEYRPAFRNLRRMRELVDARNG